TRRHGRDRRLQRGARAGAAARVRDRGGVATATGAALRPRDAPRGTLAFLHGRAPLARGTGWSAEQRGGARCVAWGAGGWPGGGRGRLLRLRCQRGMIEGYVEIPAGYRFYGIDSGISHAVSGADYGTVRTAAFMGYRMIAAAAALPAARDGTRVRIDDPRWGG